MSELLLSKRQQTTNVGENMEKREPMYTVKINRCSYYGNCRKVLQNIQNQTTIQSSNSTFGYLSEVNKNTNWERYIYTPKFITALFTVSKIWMQSKCPTIVEWTRKCGGCVCVCVCSILTIKKNEILSFATTWMDLEDITLSGKSQRKTNTV